MDDNRIFSVSALTAAIKDSLETAFPFVWVRGQVTNLARPSSGHLYFSLRDEECSLAAVWFKGSQKPGERFDPLTGEVYEKERPCLAHGLENGQEILCAGRLAVYGSRGVYQMVVELAQSVGLGRLHEEFEMLRQRLATLGYFTPDRKRPLPEHPDRVAVITAPQGAAIHDFLSIAESRGLGSVIRIYSAPVQGEAAPSKLMNALARIVREGWAQVVVLIRGGGSLEDLWAFNDEALARVVYSSPLPVLAGIGHEVDYTLVDLTADVRAATPSHAAHLLWPARGELLRRVDGLALALDRAGKRGEERIRARFDGLARDLAWRSPLRAIRQWQERLGSDLRLLASAGARFLERREARLATCSAVLAGVPQRIPARAQALARLEHHFIEAGPRYLAVAEAALARLEDALSHAPFRLPAREASLEHLWQRAQSVARYRLVNAENSLEKALLRLEAVNPRAPLARGYALVRKGDGRFVTQTGDVRAGEGLRIMVRDGEIPVLVEGDCG